MRGHSGPAKNIRGCACELAGSLGGFFTRVAGNQTVGQLIDPLGETHSVGQPAYSEGFLHSGGWNLEDDRFVSASTRPDTRQQPPPASTTRRRVPPASTTRQQLPPASTTRQQHPPKRPRPSRPISYFNNNLDRRSDSQTRRRRQRPATPPRTAAPPSSRPLNDDLRCEGADSTRDAGGWPRPCERRPLPPVLAAQQWPPRWRHRPGAAQKLEAGSTSAHVSFLQRRCSAMASFSSQRRWIWGTSPSRTGEKPTARLPEQRSDAADGAALFPPVGCTTTAPAGEARA